eukprot:6192329-Pleurochrysis_carterae.AAC.3
MCVRERDEWRRGKGRREGASKEHEKVRGRGRKSRPSAHNRRAIPSAAITLRKRAGRLPCARVSRDGSRSKVFLNIWPIYRGRTVQVEVVRYVCVYAFHGLRPLASRQKLSEEGSRWPSSSGQRMASVFVCSKMCSNTCKAEGPAKGSDGLIRCARALVAACVDSGEARAGKKWHAGGELGYQRRRLYFERDGLYGAMIWNVRGCVLVCLCVCTCVRACVDRKGQQRARAARRHLLHAVSREWWVAGEQLEREAAKRPQVDRAAVPLAEQQLRRHVVRRADLRTIDGHEGEISGTSEMRTLKEGDSGRRVKGRTSDESDACLKARRSDLCASFLATST